MRNWVFLPLAGLVVFGLVIIALVAMLRKNKSGKIELQSNKEDKNRQLKLVAQWENQPSE